MFAIPGKALTVSEGELSTNRFAGCNGNETAVSACAGHRTRTTAGGLQRALRFRYAALHCSVMQHCRH